MTRGYPNCAGAKHTMREHPVEVTNWAAQHPAGTKRMQSASEEYKDSAGSHREEGAVVRGEHVVCNALLEGVLQQRELEMRRPHDHVAAPVQQHLQVKRWGAPGRSCHFGSARQTLVAKVACVKLCACNSSQAMLAACAGGGAARAPGCRCACTSPRASCRARRRPGR